MGVHDTDKYTEVKRLLSIPEGEPIFILRAQDKFAPMTVMFYADQVYDHVGGVFHNQMDDCEKEFREWQRNNHGTVKVPD